MVLQVPPEIADLTSADKTGGIAVGEGLAPPEITVKLKPCGEIAKEQLQLIEIFDEKHCALCINIFI
jgi:hypothetical protein